MHMPSCSSFCFTFFILSTVFISSSSSSGGGGECEPPVAFFLFGDSYLDAGNNNYINTTTLDQANFWPYGESYFNYPTGRFSDGRLVSDFIAEYAKLPLIKPYLEPGTEKEYLKGVNFASAGAGALFETFRGEVISLKTQLKYFKKVERRMRKELGSEESKAILSNAVFLFSVGTNDYMSPFLTNPTIFQSNNSHPQYIGMVIGNLTIIVNEIYKRGGRKFGFMNLGPLGCLPGFRSSTSGGGCLEQLSVVAKLHNKALSNYLSTTEKRLKGFRYSLYDYEANLMQRMNHPTKYRGLKEGRRACCGTGRWRGIFSCGGKRGVKEYEVCEDPREYVFWDSYHLTQTVYQQMALQMWNGQTPTVVPYNLSTLFRCLDHLAS